MINRMSRASGIPTHFIFIIEKKKIEKDDSGTLVGMGF
jgi:hypothetical protein